MDIAATLAEIQSLPVNERIRIAQAIWDGIEAEEELVHLTEAQYRLLDRRIAAYEANPGDLLTWDEVEASLQEDG